MNNEPKTEATHAARPAPGFTERALPLSCALCGVPRALMIADADTGPGPGPVWIFWCEQCGKDLLLWQRLRRAERNEGRI